MPSDVGVQPESGRAEAHVDPSVRVRVVLVDVPALPAGERDVVGRPQQGVHELGVRDVLQLSDVDLAGLLVQPLVVPAGL